MQSPAFHLPGLGKQRNITYGILFFFGGCNIATKYFNFALEIAGMLSLWITRLWYIKIMIMGVENLNINLPLNFNQVVDIVRQLPYKEKLLLSKVLKKETKQIPENDNTLTHFASEKVLAKDWLLNEEDEAWKDL
jgi:hypothetical protein